jgi:paraquat-inducible protein B
MNFKRKLISALSGWYLWIFPVFAILITAALLKQHFEKKGPEIKILFDDAMGIQPDKTLIRFRGVVIGKVSKVTITENMKDVVAHVELDKDAKRYAVIGSKFALVVPKVSFKEVTGLETLVGGTYITVQPGPNEYLFQDEFIGQIGKDVGESLDDTVSYFLQTENLGAISIGDGVSFRGLKIGSVSKANLSKDSTSIVVAIIVQNKYTKLIRTNTKFWKKLAVQAKLGFLKAEIKINSLESFLNGGIELSTPNIPGEMAKAGTSFYLYPTPPKESDLWNPVLNFDN